MNTVAPQPGDQATVTVTIALPPAETFRVFTEEIESWWRRGPRFRNAPGESGIICIEPKLGGRIFESFSDGGRETVVEIGRITQWQPPTRLVFDWRASNFAPGEKTEVEVLFQPSASGTRVTVMHRGWNRIRPDHPVRHGLQSPEFVRMIGMWWGDLMASMRTRGVDAARD